MTDLIVEAPRADYNGKTLGVRFNNGKAQINVHSVDKSLGRSPQEVVEAFARDFPEYTLRHADGRAFTVPALPWAAEPAVSTDTGAPAGFAQPGGVAAKTPKKRRASNKA